MPHHIGQATTPPPAGTRPDPADGLPSAPVGAPPAAARYRGDAAARRREAHPWPQRCTADRVQPLATWPAVSRRHPTHLARRDQLAPERENPSPTRDRGPVFRRRAGSRAAHHWAGPRRGTGVFGQHGRQAQAHRLTRAGWTRRWSQPRCRGVARVRRAVGSGRGTGGCSRPSCAQCGGAATSDPGGSAAKHDAGPARVGGGAGTRPCDRPGPCPTAGVSGGGQRDRGGARAPTCRPRPRGLCMATSYTLRSRRDAGSGRWPHRWCCNAVSMSSG